MFHRATIAAWASAVIVLSSASSPAADRDNRSLLDRLRDPDKYVRERAISEAGQQKTTDRAVIGEITRLLEDSETTVRSSAVWTYLQLGGDVAIVRVMLFSDEDSWVRSSAFNALQSVRPDRQLAEQMLSDADGEIRRAALQSLVELGGDLKLIEPLLSDPEAFVRDSAFLELQEIRHDLELARRMLSDSDGLVRGSAVHSFLRLGGDRVELVPLLGDADTSVQFIVTRAFVDEGICLEQAVNRLAQLFASDQFVESLQVVEALSGERAVQVATQLVEVLATSDDERVINGTIWQLTEFDGLRPEHASRLMEALGRTQKAARRAAARALRELARDCPLQTETLLTALDDEDALVRAYAALALLQLRQSESAACACLRRILEVGDHDARRTVVKDLKSFSAATATAISQLLALLGDDDRSMRWDAMVALSHVPAESVIPRLLSITEAADAVISSAHFQEYVARLLKEYGIAARTALPLLIGYSAHDEPDVVFASTEALGTVGVGDAVSLEVLRAILANPQAEQRTRIAAVNSVVACVGRNEVLRGRLRDLLRSRLRDADLAVREKIAESLLALDEDPATMLPVFEELLTAENAEVVSAAMDRIVTLKDLAPASLPLLVQLLKSDVTWSNGWSAWSVRERAPSALADIGPAAVPLLIERLDDSDAEVRGNVAGALGGIGPAAKIAVDPLLRHLNDTAQYQVSMGHVGWPAAVRQDVIRALGLIGPDAASAVPQLLAQLAADSDTGFLSIRSPVVEALGNIGPMAAEAVPALWAILDAPKEDERIRIAAVCSLARITPDDSRVADKLAEHLRWLGENQREDGMLSPSDAGALLDTCAKLGNRAKKVTPALEWIVATVPLLEAELRVLAAETLVRIEPTHSVGLEYLRRRAKFEARDQYLGWVTARETLDKLSAEGVISAP